MSETIRCSFCHADLGDVFALCPGCGTRVHQDCWKQLSECPTIGCSQAEFDLLPISASGEDEAEVTDDQDAPVANPEASGAKLAVGILAAFCIGYGILDLLLAVEQGALWAKELGVSSSRRNEYARMLYPIWFFGPLVSGLAAVVCGAFLMRRGRRVKAIVICLLQVLLMTAIVSGFASFVVSSQFEGMGLYAVGGILHGLTMAFMPVVITFVVMREDVSLYLSGSGSDPDVQER